MLVRTEAARPTRHCTHAAWPSEVEQRKGYRSAALRSTRERPKAKARRSESPRAGWPSCGSRLCSSTPRCNLCFERREVVQAEAAEAGSPSLGALGDAEGSQRWLRQTGSNCEDIGQIKGRRETKVPAQEEQEGGEAQPRTYHALSVLLADDDGISLAPSRSMMLPASSSSAPTLSLLTSVPTSLKGARRRSCDCCPTWRRANSLRWTKAPMRRT